MDMEQMHLTLRFIGNADSSKFLDIQEALASIKAKRFALSLKGIGHFPPRGEPKVLWVGMEKSEPLFELRRKIDRSFHRAGIENEDRKFHPHITLARLNGSPEDWVGNFIQMHNLFRSAPFKVEEFHLYSSVLNPRGARHAIEATYGLVENTETKDES
jgi:2'-5' RNA ligase